MNKGFGLVGILISVAIVAILVGGGFYYSGTTNQVIDDNVGIDNIINQAEDVKNELEERNESVSDNLDEKPIILSGNEIIEYLGSGYTKDAKDVYYKENIINGADPNTFKILDVCGGAERSGASYAIDNHAVYVGSEIVESADPNTFKIIASFETEEGMYAWSTYAKDKDTVFSGCGNVIDNADINTFEYISEGYAKDKNNVYDWGTVLEEVIPSQCTLENIDGCKDN